MKCSKCGADVTGRFCSQCGTLVKQKTKVVINNLFKSLDNNTSITTNHLTKGELILLKYLDGCETTEILPSYFTYLHKLNTSECIEKFINNDLLGFASLEYSLSKVLVADLKKALSQNHLATNGTKKVLVQRLLNNLNEDYLRSIFPATYYSVSEKGKNLIDKTLFNNETSEQVVNTRDFSYLTQVIKLVEKKKFVAAKNMILSYGGSIGIIHTENYQAYHDFLDYELNLPSDLQAYEIKIKNSIILGHMACVYGKNLHSIIYKIYNLDLPTALITKFSKILNSIDELLVSKDISKALPNDLVYTYTINTCIDERCCNNCAKREGLHYKVIDAVIGKNYPPFDDCTCDFCRCFAAFDLIEIT